MKDEENEGREALREERDAVDISSDTEVQSSEIHKN